jgi:glucose-1-phosphate cytidylyltransferase
MFEQKPISDLVNDHQLNSFRHEEFWQSMDNYQEMQYLNRLWATGEAPWKVWKDKLCEPSSPGVPQRQLAGTDAAAT